MNEWIIKEHPDFFKDLESLDKTTLEIFYKKKQKIKSNPIRLKHLSGSENCYREAITNSFRLIYAIQGNEIWLLTIGRHDKAYAEYLNRLNLVKRLLKNQQNG